MKNCKTFQNYFNKKFIRQKKKLITNCSKDTGLSEIYLWTKIAWVGWMLKFKAHVIFKPMTLPIMCLCYLQCVTAFKWGFGAKTLDKESSNKNLMILLIPVIWQSIDQSPQCSHQQTMAAHDVCLFILSTCFQINSSKAVLVQNPAIWNWSCFTLAFIKAVMYKYFSCHGFNWWIALLSILHNSPDKWLQPLTWTLLAKQLLLSLAGIYKFSDNRLLTGQPCSSKQLLENFITDMKDRTTKGHHCWCWPQTHPK